MLRTNGILLVSPYTAAFYVPFGTPRVHFKKLRLGTDRNGLLAAGPDFAGYQSIIRLAGFCRTGTGVWKVEYKAAGTCRKF